MEVYKLISNESRGTTFQFTEHLVCSHMKGKVEETREMKMSSNHIPKFSGKIA